MPPSPLSLDGAAPGPDRLSLILLAVAALLSGLIIWWPTQSPVLVAAFVATGLMGAASLWLVRRRTGDTPDVMAQDVGQDWALLRAVADASDAALAITDRSGRLVCANENAIAWFGGVVTPPNLPVDAAIVQRLTDAGRQAWTSGWHSTPSMLVEGARVSGIVRRIGRGEDHLLWQWQREQQRDRLTEVTSLIAGEGGRALDDSGVMAVLTSAVGAIHASNRSFALRAIGALDGDPAGEDFAQLLFVDKNGLIRFARERDAEGATPLRMIEIALDRADPASPLLMLIVDEDGGPVERGVALEYVEALLARLPFGLAMVDRDGRFLFANAAFHRATKTEEGSAARYPGDLVVNEDKTPLADAIRRQARAGDGSVDIAVRLKDRPDESVSFGLTGVRGMGEAAVLLSFKDASGESELKRQVAQAQKMQAVGQLAGGIAHDFNNVLTGILGSCDLMLLRHTAGDSDYDDIQQIRSNANRAANLTRQLLAFSRQQTLRPQIVNLSDVVSDVSHLLQRLLGDRVALEVKHGRGLGLVRADPGQLEQVIVNLAVNGRDAMPDGGRLTIETLPAHIGDRVNGGADSLPPGDYTLLKVQDSGTGIAPEVLPKIFDPFFTTKEVGKGTGLGLATVYGIVKQSGGFIYADSALGRGTTFSIYLPVHAAASAGDAKPVRPADGDAQPRAAHWGSGTILLVEDEDVVRAVAERALVRSGYQVITAVHGEDGLEKFALNRDVDLIITDVMMPQMDGPTMVRDIRAGRPDVPVLFMSGYAEEQLRQSIALSNVAFLPKPFSVGQLVEAVAGIRAASSG